MKDKIHPEYFDKAKVTCACGARFVVGSTVKETKVEICSNCHPLYTGKTKLVDTAGRVDRFKERLQRAKEKQAKIKSESKIKKSPPKADQPLAEKKKK